MNASRTSQAVVSLRWRWPLMVRIAVGILVSLVAGYLAISVYAGYTLSTPKRIFEPEKATLFATPPIDVTFPATDGLEIAGWFIPAAAGDRALILVHGRNSSRTHEFGGEYPKFAVAMQRRGYSVLMIDLRGHGQSADAWVTMGLTERRDVSGAVNWLKEQGYQANKIGLLGVSMGVAAVVGAAADNPEIGALVLDSGYAEVYPVIQEQWEAVSGLPQIFLPSTLLFGQWLTGYDLTSAHPAQELAQMAPRPVLIIHGAFDPYTRVENAYQLRAAYPASEYWESSATKHSQSYNSNPQLYLDKVANFLNRSLDSTKKSGDFTAKNAESAKFLRF